MFKANTKWFSSSAFIGVSGKQCFRKTQIISGKYEMIFSLSLSLNLYRCFRKKMFKENIFRLRRVRNDFYPYSLVLWAIEDNPGKLECVSGKQCFGKTRIISVEYEMIFFLSLSISLYRRFRKTMFKENIVYLRQVRNDHKSVNSARRRVFKENNV